MLQLPRSASERKNGLWQILVVNHETDTVEHCTSALKEAGYAVRAASSAVEALELMRERPADLVLTEMAMPRMDGMQLLANLKEMYPDTCVVVMSSGGTIGDAMEAMRRGAADFIPMPFESRALQRTVACCLGAVNTRRCGAFLNETAALLDLARNLSKTTDPHALPQKALELACRNFAADSAILFHYDPAQEALFVMAHSGRSLTRRCRTNSLTEQCLEAIRRRTVLLDADVPSGDWYAFMPLFVSDRPLGALCLRRADGPRFQENSIELMEMFAAHLAVTLESARFYETAAEQVAELEELVTVSRSLSLNADRGHMCRQLLNSAARLTAAEICAVLLLTDKGAELKTSPAVAKGSPILEAIQDKMAASLRMDGAAEAGAVPAPARTPGRFALEARRALVSCLSAPLIAGEKPFGLLAAFSSRPHAFSAEDARRLSALAEGASAAADNAEALSRISLTYQETLEFFADMVDARCPDTHGHSRQVRTYAGHLARTQNITAREVFLIEDAALLHDVGKICIPDTLLCKPGPLTVEESGIVATHPVIGARMFAHTVHLRELAPIIRHHHERFDGQGYPDRLCGEAIPLGARIVAICDMFDALVSHRIYRPAMNFAAARSMMAEWAGSRCDPALVSAFLNLALERMTEH
jgi:response regulator RpfG family c-di-GMP phosphodiesterase